MYMRPPQVTAEAATGKSAAAEGGSEARAKRFLPFSAGTRDCVGQSLARMNYTTTVAMLLTHFKFQLTPEVIALAPITLFFTCISAEVRS